MVEGHDGRSTTAGPKPAPSFRCPHCSAPLELVVGGRELACSGGHRFDRAREGYVNLLVGGRLPGGPSGDDEAMVRARRRVFDAGLYAPIIDAVAGAVVRSGARDVLDAGCGEGSYLGRAVDLAADGGRTIDAWGIDISRVAVRLAARRHRGHHYAVASSYQLPFADASFEALVNVFSPRSFGEMRRVLQPGGVAIVVTPGPDHLAQLKALIYDEPRRHRLPADDATEPDRGDPVETERVEFAVDLHDAALRMSLLEMTPYWWSTRPERREVIAATLRRVDADMVISTYRSLSSPSGPG